MRVDSYLQLHRDLHNPRKDPTYARRREFDREQFLHTFPNLAPTTHL